MANTNVTIRIDDELKREADALFEKLGMSFTTAVNVFVTQAVREERIPFEITLNPRLTEKSQDYAERIEYRQVPMGE